MKWQLVSSLTLSVLVLACLSLFQPQQANAVPFNYNTTDPIFPLTPVARSNYDIFVSSGNNGTINQWFTGSYGAVNLNYKLGTQPNAFGSSITLPIGKDTVANMTREELANNATQNISITIANNANRTLIVGISLLTQGTTDHNKGSVSSVKLGSSSFTKAVNKTITSGGSVETSEIWYLVNPPTGSVHITITPTQVSTNYFIIAGALSLFNVNVVSPVGATATNTGTSITPTITITPTFTNSWLFNNMFSEDTADAKTASDTIQWNQRTSATGVLGGGQTKSSPTISGANTMTWTTRNHLWSNTAIEIKGAVTSNPGLILNCALTSTTTALVSSGSSIYYACGTSINHIDSITGTNTHDFTTSCTPTLVELFVTSNNVMAWCIQSGNNVITTSTGNVTITATGTATSAYSDQKIGVQTSIIRANFNNTTPLLTIGNDNCDLLYLPDNSTIKVQDIGCDIIIPNTSHHYYQGMDLINTAKYRTNSTLLFLTNTENNPYKKYLTLLPQILNIPDPYTSLVVHSSTDNIVYVTSNTIYYIPTTSLATSLSGHSTQTYMNVILSTTTNYPVITNSSNAIFQQPMKLYGTNINSNITISRFGMYSTISGFIAKSTSIENTVRSIDSRWTNDAQNYPVIGSTTAQFPMVITVNNAPTDGGLKLVSSSQIIQNNNAIWCVTQLDSTHTAECDVTVNQCPLVYVSDISVAPTIWLYEGSVCASGSNTKTIAFTNTLPLNFWNLPYGVTDTYVPQTNALQTAFHTTITPTTYNVIVKNSTGAVALNNTFTLNGTLDIQNYNVSSITKPAGLFVYAGGNLVYSAYLGSSLSLASTASFFNQYLSYQGFNLLAFIPIVFASMFTRNTVGIGVVLTVLCIATLSWLSIVVIPDMDIAIMMLIAIIGLIAYRIYYG